MPNRMIRAQQSANSKKIDIEGFPLIRQRDFPKATRPVSRRYRSEREMDRRKRQIQSGQIKEANGLLISRDI